MSSVHAAAYDTVLEGYRIPKDTWIIPILFTVNEDDNTWEEPDVFKPERFLDENGKCHRPDYLVPFGIGMLTTPLTAASIVQLVSVTKNVFIVHMFDLVLIDV